MRASKVVPVAVVPCYIEAASVSDVMWEQFEFMMLMGTDPLNKYAPDRERFERVSRILMEPFGALHA